MCSGSGEANQGAGGLSGSGRLSLRRLASSFSSRSTSAASRTRGLGTDVVPGTLSRSARCLVSGCDPSQQRGEDQRAPCSLVTIALQISLVFDTSLIDSESEDAPSSSSSSLPAASLWADSSFAFCPSSSSPSPLPRSLGLLWLAGLRMPSGQLQASFFSFSLSKIIGLYSAWRLRPGGRKGRYAERATQSQSFSPSLTLPNGSINQSARVPYLCRSRVQRV